MRTSEMVGPTSNEMERGTHSTGTTAMSAREPQGQHSNHRRAHQFFLQSCTGFGTWFEIFWKIFRHRLKFFCAHIWKFFQLQCSQKFLVRWWPDVHVAADIQGRMYPSLTGYYGTEYGLRSIFLLRARQISQKFPKDTEKILIIPLCKNCVSRLVQVHGTMPKNPQSFIVISQGLYTSFENFPSQSRWSL